MNILYFDAFSGASGDMILGSLIHLGVDFDFLKEQLAQLNLSNYQIDHEKKKVSGIESTKFNIHFQPEKKHRHLSDISKIINESTLEEIVKSMSLEIFEIIAVAEAKVHGTTKEKIHFHEVGAIDSIIDIVGSCIAINSLDINKIMSSPLPLGRGFVKCDHGNMPLPAPATIEILKDFPTYGVEDEGEYVTPTGAAILKCWVDEIGDFPSSKVQKIGYGAGTIERQKPNLLRVILAEEVKDKVSSISDNDRVKKNSF